MTGNTDWTELPYFLAAARTGSLRAAAEICGGTHATVDRHIKALEGTYGVRLFERSRAGLVLTTAGEALVPIAEEAETSVNSARRRLKGLDREAAGRVRFSVPPSLAYDILPPLLSDFSDRHPEIDLQVTVTNRFESIARNETDVSMRVAFEVSDDVTGRRVLRYATGIYASREYLDQHLPEAGPLGEGLTWIGWGDAERVPEWVRSSPFPRADVRHAVREGVMVARMVEAGIGMSWLPHYATQYLRDLALVPGTELKEDRSIWLLLHSDLRRTTRVRLLVDFLADGLKAKRTMFRGSLDP